MPPRAGPEVGQANRGTVAVGRRRGTRGVEARRQESRIAVGRAAHTSGGGRREEQVGLAGRR